MGQGVIGNFLRPSETLGRGFRLGWGFRQKSTFPTVESHILIDFNNQF